MMICDGDLYQACDDLFASYPLAAEADSQEAARSMVLMLTVAGEGKFYILIREAGDGGTVYHLQPWRDGQGGVPAAEARQAVTRGFPLPADGSLFGWKDGGAVTALIAFYAEYGTPNPTWSVMPRADIPAGQWPPFTSRALLGGWFWEHHRAGRAVPLARLIAATPGAVFWVAGPEPPGWGCCVVTRDLAAPEGFTLPRGRYAYYRALQGTAPIPAIGVLLSDPGKADLAPRFEDW
jgi:hypothetical protein